MIYLKVAHVDDEDADYFSFSGILSAANYILDEHITEYFLSDIMSEEVSESDYTFIESQ